MIHRPSRGELLKQVGEVGEGVDALDGAGADETVEDRRVLGASVGAGEETRLSTHRNLAVMLPMSGRAS